MKLEDFEITTGINNHQTATIERNDKTIDYTSSKKLSYAEILSLATGLNVISEFFDVHAVVTVSGTTINAVALGKSQAEAITNAMNTNSMGFVNSNVIVSSELDCDSAKLLKNSNIIAAPKFTKNAIEYLESHNICYVTVNTPLKDYKTYLSNETIVTPLGTLIQSPNTSELNKDTFKVESKTKPTVEQIEDAVFAWKIAKYAKSRSVVVAKDFVTSAISQGLSFDAVEYALNISCEMTKEAILASDSELTIHDINAAVQCRISMIIAPSASKEIIQAADKYNLAIITTGIENILY